jgi:hypothetical protein
LFDPEKYTQGKWLKGSDLPAGKQTIVTIKGGREHTFEKTGEKKPVLSYIELAAEMTINPTQMGTLMSMFGKEPNLWLGQRIALMPVPSGFEGKPTIMIMPAPSQFPGATAHGVPPQQPPQAPNGDVIFGSGNN